MRPGRFVFWTIVTVVGLSWGATKTNLIGAWWPVKGR